ncbi:GNAT family N-acetyltransferase [Nonomuraea sp. NBC_01738]|uniref:GNAT family N-acetyltransferase n=1 Tax=Nonomuraea sp. NBC_01738 TaxID=2976003 RepID=UPI002E0EB1A7|nr:GNAT family N-acetyltransferase [Nonomuraea sp. NBC_01738]
METLAELLDGVARGRLPEADGGVTLLPQPSDRDLGVMAFTGHSVVFADLDPLWVRGYLQEADVAAPMNPPFLRALERKTGRRVDGIDVLALAQPLDEDAGADVVEITGQAHPRVARSHRYRDDVRVWGCASGILVLGRGVAGRLEVAVEVAPERRGRGVGRSLALAARRLAKEPLWAQVAPGNAASLRAFLAAGYTPVGSEALLPPE